jgi:hypothetical protein
MPAGSTERAPTHRPPFPQTETVTVETYGPLKVACEYEAKGAFGNRAAIEFLEQGELMGIAMRHPNGGPEFGLRLDPARAEAAAGFDYFAIGVPSKEAIQDLAARLTALGDPHAGVHFATIGWILPELHDPDGHEVRFYTTAHHSEPPSDGVVRIENPRGSAEATERAIQDGRR